MNRWIHALSALGLALASSACGAAPPPPALAAPAPTSTPDLRWRAVRIPQLGVTLEMPGAPLESSTVMTKSGVSMLGRGVELTLQEKDQKIQFVFLRMDSSAKDREADEPLLQRMSATLKSVDSRDPLLVSGFRGIAFEGTSSDGTSIMERVVVAGKSTFLLVVEAPRGAMPRADALRFLDSFRVEPVWSVVAIPELHCTVALPDVALGLRLEALTSSTTRFQSFFVGGPGDLVYYLSETPIDASVSASKSVDEILDDAVQLLASLPGAKIHAATPTSLEGLKGRDVLTRSGKLDKELHLRLFAVGGHLYQLGISATTPDLVSDEVALRFLGSLRVNPVP